MSPELRLIPAGGPEPQSPVIATFRADARLRLWGAALCAAIAIAFTGLGYEKNVPPVIAGPVAAAFLLWSAYLLATFAARRSVRYTFTAQRLEIESGLLGKRYESVELWRVRDVVLEQTLIERLRGVGRLTVYSSDQAEPVLGVGPVASARPLFDRLRDAVAAARKEAQVVPLDPGR
jgi:membrane protein YdbS with pleckstrin-like domain